MIFPIFEIATELASSNDRAMPTAHRLFLEYWCSFFETHSGAFFFENPELVAQEKNEDITINVKINSFMKNRFLLPVEFFEYIPLNN